MNQYSLVLILSLSILMFSCGEDDTPPSQKANDNLSGTWVASSYTINGQETIGTTYTAVDLTFSPSEDLKGTFSTKFTEQDGDTPTVTSTYTLVDDGDRIKLGSDTLNLMVTESNFEMDGDKVFFTAGNIVIKASK